MKALSLFGLIVIAAALLAFGKSPQCMCRYQIHYDGIAVIDPPCQLPDTIIKANTKLIIKSCTGDAYYQELDPINGKIVVEGNYIANSSNPGIDSIYILDEETYDERLIIREAFHPVKDGCWQYSND